MTKFNFAIRRFVAFFCAVIIICNVSVLHSYAAFSPALPLSAASAEALAFILGGALVAGGVVSQADVDGMTSYEIINRYKSELAKGYVDASNRGLATLAADVLSSPLGQAALTKLINDSSLSDASELGDYIKNNIGAVNQVSNAKYPTFNLNGYGALVVYHSSILPTDGYYFEYCSYAKFENIRTNVYLAFYGGGSERIMTLAGDPVHGFEAKGYPYHIGAGCVLVNSPTQCSDLHMFGDIRNADGTVATDKITPLDTVASDVGTVIIDGTSYPISGTGTVTVGGKDYVINSDGTVTIDGKTYNPTYDGSSLNPTTITNTGGLLNIYVDIAAKSGVIDNTKPVVPAVDIPDSLTGDLSGLDMPLGISDCFPFCIPFDFVRGINLMAATPVAPKFTVPFNVPSFGLFPGSDNDIVLDFTKYDVYFKLVRWFILISYSLSLCFISFKLVKGV